MNFVNVCWPGGYKLNNWGGSNFYPFPPILAKPFATIFPSMAWGVYMVFEKTDTYKNEFIQFPSNNNLETNYYVGSENK